MRHITSCVCVCLPKNPMANDQHLEKNTHRLASQREARRCCWSRRVPGGLKNKNKKAGGSSLGKHEPFVSVVQYVRRLTTSRGVSSSVHMLLRTVWKCAFPVTACTSDAAAAMRHLFNSRKEVFCFFWVFGDRGFRLIGAFAE